VVGEDGGVVDRFAFSHDASGLREMDPLKDFLHDEAAGGVVLVVGAVAAEIWANSPFSGSYGSFWHYELTLGRGS
jgi:NhaA family Na+:H+ antiporter